MRTLEIKLSWFQQGTLKNIKEYKTLLFLEPSSNCTFRRFLLIKKTLVFEKKTLVFKKKPWYLENLKLVAFLGRLGEKDHIRVAFFREFFP